MFYVSRIFTTPPDSFKSALQKSVYRVLGELGIAYERVDTDEAVTMDDCVLINERLGMEMVTTLFLCGQARDVFYLYITSGGSRFNAKKFSRASGAPHLSFAPAELMLSMLGTKVGAATVYSALLDVDNRVKIVFDKAVAEREWYGCSDGTTTGYMKLRTSDIIGPFLRYAKHEPLIIEA